MITQREQAILDRSDRGVSLDAIASELGLSRAYVRKTVTFFSGDHRPRHDKAIALGSATLLAAITQARSPRAGDR